MLHRQGARLCQRRATTLLHPLRLYRNERRAFSSRSSGPRAESTHGSTGSCNGSTTSDGSVRALNYFLDVQVACRNKKCRLSAPDMGIVSIPDACGEDSFFVSHNVIGVADGVGGWNENGVDPGKISRSLMRNAGIKADSSDVSVSTHALLTHGYAMALVDPEVEAGSTTACIIRLRESVDGLPIIEYTNLGDSGFVIIRDGVLVFRSKFQAYGRAPYQLAKIPPQYKSYGAIENHPSDAESGEIKVQCGDIIVLATDGVWDNFSSDLLNARPFYPPIMSWRQNWHNEIAGLADVLAEDQAHAAQNVVKAALRHNLKPDDVTVVVATVVRRASKL